MDFRVVASMSNGGSCSSRWSLSTPADNCTNPPPRTLQAIRDNATTIYNRVKAQGYKECQSDILDVSGIAEDIRDALLEYQVSSESFHADKSVGLKSRRFDRRPSNGQYMTRIAD